MDLEVCGLIRCALMGCGRWGRNFFRVLQETPGVQLVAVADEDPAVRAELRRIVPGLAIGTAAELLDSEGVEVDAAIIATPAAALAQMAGRSLDRGWHVLVEKPFARDLCQAAKLVERAERAKRVLMLGHTFLYHPAIREMRSLYQSGVVGKPYFLHARRTHLDAIRPDVSVVWDLALHDVAILRYLLDELPHKVSATGSVCLQARLEDVAFINLTFPSGILANIFVSWADVQKARHMQLVGSHGTILFDDLEALEPLKAFERGVADTPDPAKPTGRRLLFSDGPSYTATVPPAEPLRVEVEHFLHCVRTGDVPLSDGRSGMEILGVLEAIDRSIRSDGAPVSCRVPQGATLDAMIEGVR